jgi:hypothetical protein
MAGVEGVFFLDKDGTAFTFQPYLSLGMGATEHPRPLASPEEAVSARSRAGAVLDAAGITLIADGRPVTDERLLGELLPVVRRLFDSGLGSLRGTGKGGPGGPEASPPRLAPLGESELAELPQRLVRDLQLGARTPRGRNRVWRELGYTEQTADRLAADLASIRPLASEPPHIVNQEGEWWKVTTRGHLVGPSGARARVTVVWHKAPGADTLTLHRAWTAVLDAAPPDGADPSQTRPLS